MDDIDEELLLHADVAGCAVAFARNLGNTGHDVGDGDLEFALYFGRHGVEDFPVVIKQGKYPFQLFSG